MSNKNLIRSFVFITAVFFLTGAHADNSNNDITVSNAWVQAMPPSQKITAAYMIIANGSHKEAVLVSASSEIAGATDHVAQVAVTNTGSETLTVFKGNTVFSDHATKDLLVADAGAEREAEREGGPAYLHWRAIPIAFAQHSFVNTLDGVLSVVAV